VGTREQAAGPVGAALALVLAILAPLVLTSAYHRNILVTTVVYAIAALSLDLVMGQMGQFSFAHAAFWGIGAYASAKVATSLDASVWIGFLVAPAATAAIGFGVGAIALRRTRGLELAIVTLGFGVVMWLVALRWYGFTGGPTGIGDLPVPSFFGFELVSDLSYYYLCLGFLLPIVYAYSRFVRSRFGRAVRSIHENEALASSIGVSTTRYYVLTFSLSAGVIGFAGALNAHHFRFIAPNLLATDFMIILLIMVIVGGRGTVAGPVVGAAIYVWATELLRDVSESLRFLVFGVVLLVIVLVMPQGVYPTLRELGRRLVRGRFDPRAPLAPAEER
jgi:branched-chain amino acid transport system permease protein